MLNIKKDQTLKEPIFLEDPYPLLVFDDFISKDKCRQLINEASDAIRKETHKVMGGRYIIPWQSNIFKELIEESSCWDDFRKTMPRKAFKIFEEISEKELSHNAYFRKWKKGKRLKLVNHIYSLTKKLLSRGLYKSYRKGLDMPCRMIPIESLIFYGFLGLLDSTYRKLKSIIDLLKNEITLLPLFEYNSSYEGYEREVHRDTDSRVLVCILYLNEIEDLDEIENNGGALEIFKNISDINDLSPQPKNSEVKKIANIEPKSGRLVIFFNQSNSYHAVSKMNYSEKGRHFIYGGFSLQSSLNSPARIRSKSKLPTNYLIYR